MNEHTKCPTCGRIFPQKYPKKSKVITANDLRECREKSLDAKRKGYTLKPCPECKYFSRCGGIEI